MLSNRELDYLLDKPMSRNQQKYIRYCIRRKLKAFETRDLPALLANAWSAGLFKQVLQVMNCNNQVMDGNNFHGRVEASLENRGIRPLPRFELGQVAPQATALPGYATAAV